MGVFPKMKEGNEETQGGNQITRGSHSQSHLLPYIMSSEY